MGARDRRTDDFTEATATRGDRETVRIDPPIALGAAKRRDSKRLITVHEGPVHRVRVGVPPQDLPLDDVEVDELQEAEVEVPAAADDLAAELLATKAALEDNQPPPLDPGDRPTVVGLDAIADDEEDTADRELPEEATDPEQQAVADEPAEVVQLPLSRRPKSAPKVILSDQLQEATARH